jgi:F420H(2)-dependent quinone reductase
MSSLHLPRGAQPLLNFLGSPRGRRLDARLIRVTGYSPYAYLYGMEMGRKEWSYKPPLALTTIGWKSGRLHIAGLAYYEVDGTWALIGSAGGSEREPHWVRNLRANEAAWVSLHRHTTPVLATVLDGDAKQPIWKIITERQPLFATFQSRVQRDIPVIVLQPRQP